MVKPEALRMSSCTACLLGQLFGEENEQKLMKMLPMYDPQEAVFPWDADDGFGRGQHYLRKRQLYPHDNNGVFSADSILKCYWTEEIAERLAQDDAR